MKRFNIKIKPKHFKINPAWKITSDDKWTYYHIGGVREQKLIIPTMENYYIIFEGDIVPFELQRDRDHLTYFPAKDYMFAPNIYISHQDKDGWIHIRTEAGAFKVKFYELHRN